MDWQALDMEMEQWQRDFDRRFEEGRGEIRARIEGVERRCKEAEAVRRRDWEELKGRMMTTEEERKHQSDGILRLMSGVTDEYIRIIRAVGEDMKRGFAESRAESRAQSEALMRVLDRLPPPENDSWSRTRCLTRRPRGTLPAIFLRRPYGRLVSPAVRFMGRAGVLLSIRDPER